MGIRQTVIRSKVKEGLENLGVFPREFSNKIADAISQNIPTLEKIVDVGHAKDLRPVRELARAFNKVKFVYFDNNPDFIRTWMAKVEAKKMMLPINVEIAGSTDIEDYKPFDLAVYFLTLHHFFDGGEPLETLQRVHRLLRPEGLVLVFDYHLADDSGRAYPKEDAEKIFEPD